MPRNSEQACLFDILNNKNITVAYAGGRFGAGKSFILNNFALQELEKGNIQKIVYVPNNSFVHIVLISPSVFSVSKLQMHTFHSPTRASAFSQSPPDTRFSLHGISGNG